MDNSWEKAKPKIKIAKTTSEKIWDIIGYSFYIGSILFLIYAWGKLPDEVPGHFNMAGEVTRWGSKYELIILPLVGGFNLLFIQILELFPEIHNYPKRFNESNAKEFYLNSRKLLNIVKNVCLLIFAVISYESVSIALGWGGGFSKWFIPITILGTGIPIVISLMKRKQIR